ncbi:MAG: hypothetical protein ACRAVC_09485 [Trichormus sp.]
MSGCRICEASSQGLRNPRSTEGERRVGERPGYVTKSQSVTEFGTISPVLSSSSP